MEWYCQISVNRQNGCLEIQSSDKSQNQQNILPAIKEYIVSYNNTCNSKQILNGDGTFYFFLVVHKMSDLYSNKSNQRYIFRQKELVLDRVNNKPIYPIIHLSIVDFIKNDLIFRYKCYPDSSIWNYYVPIEVTDNRYNFQRFEQAIKEISENAINRLYDFSISKEFAEFNARLLQVSYIRSFENKSNNGHADFISPFLFHSEWKMKKRIKEGNVSDESDVSCKYLTLCKWRILLVDDYANKSLLKDNSEDNKDLCPYGKLKIIINDINKIGKHNIAWCTPFPDGISKREDIQSTDIHWNYKATACNSQSNIYIVYVQTKDEALMIMKYFKFDFILLDYLLGDGDNKLKREYTYELLNQIKEEYDNVQKNNKQTLPEKKSILSGIAPLNRLYFMYISAFVPAISERLQEQGLIRDTPYWHIARGACPTNTPYLFLYYLYRLMEKRYNEMSLGKESGLSGHTLVDFLNNIFDDDFKKVKYKASKYFNTLLNLRNKYDIMKHDVYDEDSNLDWLHKRGSLLVYSLFPDIKCYSNAFWEHMQQLIYLVAFGTVRQWPEMWEEYVFVRDRLKEAEQKVQTVNNCPFRKVRLLSDKIEDYIILLRNR